MKNLLGQLPITTQLLQLNSVKVLDRDHVFSHNPKVYGVSATANLDLSNPMLN